MNLMTGILVFISVWVVLLFMVLPIGARSASEPQAGWDSGAPQKSNISFKLLLTTLLATLVWGVLFALDLNFETLVVPD